MTWPEIHHRLLILALAEWMAIERHFAEEARLRRREH